MRLSTWDSVRCASKELVIPVQFWTGALGQTDILELLEKEKRFMTIREISEALKIGQSSVSSSLVKLHKQGVIKRKNVPTGNKLTLLYCYND